MKLKNAIHNLVGVVAFVAATLFVIDRARDRPVQHLKF